MESTGQQGTVMNTVRAKIEFPIWYSSFATSYAAWANAPSDLKTPLLLQGPALAKAETWLLAAPERLTESQKRFIVRSISQRAKGPGEQSIINEQATGKKRWEWRRTADSSLLSLYAVIGFGLWWFSPEFVGKSLRETLRDSIEQSINDPEVYKRLRAARTGGLPGEAPVPPLIDEHAAQEGEPNNSGEPNGANSRPEEAPTEMAPPPPPPPPPVSRAKRLADLARQKLDAGEARLALLVGIEAAETAIEEGENGARTATAAASMLAGALAEREQLGELAARSATAKTTLFCEDARALVTVTAEEALSAWPASGSRRIATHAMPTPTLEGAAIDRDCRRLLLPNADFNVEVRPLAGGRTVVELHGHEATIAAAAFSPDGSAIVTASKDGTARIWDARTGRMRHLLSGHDWHVVGAQFSPDGRSVLTASSDKTARIWDTATGRQLVVLADHQGVVTSARFSSDGRSVLTTSWDGFVRLADAATGKARLVLRLAGGILKAELSRDGQRIATAQGEGGVQLWDAAAGTLLHSLPGQGILSMLFTPDSRLLASLAWDGSIEIYDVGSGTLSATYGGGQERVRAMQLAQGGKALVGITESGLRLTWPLLTTPAEAVAQAKTIAPACLTADERTTLGLEGDSPAWCSSSRPRGAVLR